MQRGFLWKFKETARKEARIDKGVYGIILICNMDKYRLLEKAERRERFWKRQENFFGDGPAS